LNEANQIERASPNRRELLETGSRIAAGPAEHSDLVFDIGFHNGDDSAYYLSCGYRVIAVDANPLLVEKGRDRFKAEIASGRFTILNLAMWHTCGEKIPFYINDTYSGKSSIDPARDQPGGNYHQIETETISISSLFETYGIPLYLKIDIEGADEIVLSTLPREWPAPKYLSCELGEGSSMLDLLCPLGYTSFKLINPQTLTQSLPIYNSELFIRALRKISVLYPPACSLIRGLPKLIRPTKTLWDPPRDRLSYQFSIYSTGPFAEETDGPWLSEAKMRRHLDYLSRQEIRDGIKQHWFDLHAKRGDAKSSS
jgi:FkbM family methyltransferase